MEISRQDILDLFEEESHGTSIRTILNEPDLDSLIEFRMYNKIKNHKPANLKEARHKRIASALFFKMTQDQIAWAIGVNKSTISRQVKEAQEFYSQR